MEPLSEAYDPIFHRLHCASNSALGACRVSCAGANPGRALEPCTEILPCDHPRGPATARVVASVVGSKACPRSWIAASDSDAILADIEAITRIESPPATSPRQRVLDVIAGWFEGTGATLERFKIDERFGDMLRVTCDPGRNERRILC